MFPRIPGICARGFKNARGRRRRTDYVFPVEAESVSVSVTRTSQRLAGALFSSFVRISVMAVLKSVGFDQFGGGIGVRSSRLLDLARAGLHSERDKRKADSCPRRDPRPASPGFHGAMKSRSS